jgi:hypothetical protein
MVEQLKDNTAVKGVRRELQDDSDKLTERMNRLQAAAQDAFGELSKETREGMANRVDDGFSPAEARKYGEATVKIMELIHLGFKAIEGNFVRDMEAIIGPNAYKFEQDGTVTFDVTKLGGKLSTGSLGVEQDQLKIVVLQDAPNFNEGDEGPTQP